MKNTKYDAYQMIREKMMRDKQELSEALEALERLIGKFGDAGLTREQAIEAPNDYEGLLIEQREAIKAVVKRLCDKLGTGEAAKISLGLTLEEVDIDGVLDDRREEANELHGEVVRLDDAILEYRSEARRARTLEDARRLNRTRERLRARVNKMLETLNYYSDAEVDGLIDGSGDEG